MYKTSFCGEIQSLRRRLFGIKMIIISRQIRKDHRRRHAGAEPSTYQAARAHFMARVLAFVYSGVIRRLSLCEVADVIHP